MRLTRPGGRCPTTILRRLRIMVRHRGRCAGLGEATMAILPLIMTQPRSCNPGFRLTCGRRSPTGSARHDRATPRIFPLLWWRMLPSTETAAVVESDQFLVDLVNSVSPWAANPFMLKQLGEVYDVQPGGRDQHGGLCRVLWPAGLCDRARLHGGGWRLQLRLPRGRHHRRKPPVAADLLRLAAGWRVGGSGGRGHPA